jgi:hypothetical protein
MISANDQSKKKNKKKKKKVVVVAQEEEDVEEEEEAPVTSSKQTPKKGRKGAKGDEKPDEMDEVDRALAELNIKSVGLLRSLRHSLTDRYGTSTTEQQGQTSQAGAAESKGFMAFR